MKKTIMLKQKPKKTIILTKKPVQVRKTKTKLA